MMQGFSNVLKMMGIDAASLEAQAKQIIGDAINMIKPKVDKMEADIAEIKQVLIRLDAHYVPSEMTDQLTLASLQSMALDKPLPETVQAESGIHNG